MLICTDEFISPPNKCTFDGNKYNSNQKWNNDKRRCESNNSRKHVCKKYYTSNPSSCPCENRKYLESITGHSVIICDKIIERTRTVPIKTFLTKTIPTKTIPAKTITTSFNEKKVTCKIKLFYILLTFLLITISPLKIVSIYCYLIKHRLK